MDKRRDKKGRVLNRGESQEQSGIYVYKYADYFRKHNYLQNKRVRVVINNEIFIGEVVGIDDSFCLQVLSSDMLLHIDSGEIEIL